MVLNIIDLSVPIDNNSKEPFPAEIKYTDHRSSVERASNLFGIDAKDWPEGKAWATEFVSLTTHTGTHIDAPYHYWDKTGEKPAKKVHELPLSWFIGDGVLLNFSHKEPGSVISKNEVIEELKRINHILSPGEIVLIRTDSDKEFFNDHYADIHPGISAEATQYLIKQGIKVMGTDGYGWDVPFHIQGKKFKDTNDPSVLWEAHYVGKELEYVQIEKLANLDKIPTPTGFKVIAFPIKITGASGSWVRPVAILGL